MTERFTSAESAYIRKGPESLTSQLNETLKDKQDIVVDVDGIVGSLTNRISLFTNIERDGAMVYIEKFGTKDYYLILRNSLFHKLYDDDLSDEEGKELYNNKFVLIDGSTGEIKPFNISDDEGILRVGDRLFISDKQQISIAAPMIITHTNGASSRVDKKVINTGVKEKISMTGSNSKTSLFMLYGDQSSS